MRKIRTLSLTLCLAALCQAGLRAEDTQREPTLPEKLYARTGQMIEEARLLKTGLEGRARLTCAYFLDVARVNAGGQFNGTSPNLLVAIEDMNKELVQKWAEKRPELDRKLDLVLRDKSLAEALEAVAAAAKVKIRLLPGSEQDVGAILGLKEVRINYLDLRRAKLSQALDWILTASRMTWWPEEGGFVAGTERRREGQSAWVYDISLLITPRKEELATETDAQKRLAAFKDAVKDLVNRVRQDLALKDEDAVWYDAGQLLVWADQNTHAAAAKLFHDLADPQATPRAELSDLHKLTSQRATAHAQVIIDRIQRRELQNVRDALKNFPLKLVTEAARGKLDLEALTELQIAWKSPALKAVLSEGAALPLRALWAIAESSRTLPQNEELAALAKQARELARPVAERALAEVVAAAPDCAPLTYAALALRDDKEFLTKAQLELFKAPISVPGQFDARVLTAALFDDEPGKLKLEFKRALTDDDAVLLTALAARRIGGDTWNTFRADIQELVGRQPRAGQVLLLVNQLSRARLPLLAATR